MVEDNQEQGGGAAPLPDEQGFYGEYGGRYVPEMLVPALDELEEAYHHWKEEEGFVAEVEDLLKIIPAGQHRCISQRTSASTLAGRRSTSSRRGLAPPAPTRSTTVSARWCLPPG